MVENLKQFLFKKQSVEGTPETSLVGTDFLELEPSSGIEPDVTATEINLVGNGFDQDAAVIGRYRANVTATAPLRPFGAADSSTAPDYGALLECAGFSETEQNSYFDYVPISTSTTDGTLWEYSGDLNTSSCLLTKAGNLKFDWKVTLDFSGDVIGKIEFTGAGRYDGASTTATQPSITKNRTAVPPLRGVTMQINADADYRPISFEFTGNQEVEPTVLASHASGVGLSKITSRKIKFTGKFYRDITTTTDPQAAMFALTEGLTSFSWSTTNGIVVAATYTQITKVTSSDENGCQTYDVEGQCNRNDFKIRVLGGTSSSSSASS